MNIFKKIAISIQAGTEDLVGKLENHEAVAESMIEEMGKALALAKVQLNRIGSDRSLTEKKLIEIDKQVLLWKDRARRVAVTDESKAMECVWRIKLLQDENVRLKESLSELTGTELKLQQNINSLEDRLREIKRRKNSLLCRQSCSDALSLAEKFDSNSHDEISHTLERWESAIMVNEYLNGETVHCDELKQSCEKEEQAAALKNMLDEIMNEQTNESKS
jgi:phage shock protein A